MRPAAVRPADVGSARDTEREAARLAVSTCRGRGAGAGRGPGRGRRGQGGEKGAGSGGPSLRCTCPQSRTTGGAAAGSWRTMGAHCHLPVPPPPGCGFSQEAKPLRALSGTKKSGGVLSSKKWPGATLPVRCGRTIGLRPHPGPSCPHVLTLVSPPLPVLPSPSSSAGLRRRGRGPAVKKGHLIASAAAPPGPPSSCSSREGRGGSRAVNVLLAPLASCRQNPERGSGAQGTRGWRLRSCGTRRNADAAGFSCPEGGDSLPPGLSEIDLKLRKRVVARVAQQLLLRTVKFHPWRHLRLSVTRPGLHNVPPLCP